MDRADEYLVLALGCVGLMLAAVMGNEERGDRARRLLEDEDDEGDEDDEDSCSCNSFTIGLGERRRPYC